MTSKKPIKKASGKWVAAVGITTPKDRYEPGDPVPQSVVTANKWLQEQGKVVKADS